MWLTQKMRSSEQKLAYPNVLSSSCMCCKGMLDIQKSQMWQSQMKKSNVFTKLKEAIYNTLILTLSFKCFVKNNIVPEYMFCKKSLQRHVNGTTVWQDDHISLGGKRDIYACM